MISYKLLFFLPLISTIFTYPFGVLLGSKTAQYLSSGLISLSAIISWMLFIDFYKSGSNEMIIPILDWLLISGQFFNWGIAINSLTLIMLTLVLTVSALVHIYSIEYMAHDKSKVRFMTYLSLFTFCMVALVVSDNLIQLFFGWEGVGLASYLLIGFWHHKKSANLAAMKAFLVNRVADFGFLIGIASLYIFLDTLSINEIIKEKNFLLYFEIEFLGMNVDVLTFACFFLFIGAMGKSAQFGFHTWLPDAMEGPTPVSALIHAATMVTAGVFLVVRCSPIYEYSQFALSLITIIGMTTAIFAASVALVQNDIKKIIAYSTCSQLGYMFFAAGVGAYNVAMFHLFTHAFFKALLFLGSGSVIHSFKNEQDITNMGGVWKKLPYTYAFMIIGTLALTGFPFLSGYYSKDAIIEFAYLRGSNLGYLAAFIGVFTAFLTSIYSWRLIFKTFHGNYNNKTQDIKSLHESPYAMLIPLLLLSIGAIAAGFLFKDLFIGHEKSYEFWGESILFLEPLNKDHPPNWFIFLTPVLVILSIPLSYYIFIKNKKITEELVYMNKPFYNFLKNKWYFDELYQYIFVNFSKKIGMFFWKKIDLDVIDKFGPDGISNLIKKFSLKAVKFQSGFIYQYAFVMLIGFSIFLTLLIIN